MSMAVGSSASESGDVVPDMNTTPLIDVMLVLLVMIIMSIPIQTHAVKLDMPRPNPNQQNNQPREVVDLEIDFDGTVLWNGNVVTGERQLAGYFLDVASQPDQAEIHLRPNRLVKYNSVARVLAIAQRLGVKRLGFVGNEQFL
jgi:biopolymer transport protein ExbD